MSPATLLPTLALAVVLAWSANAQAEPAEDPGPTETGDEPTGDPPDEKPSADNPPDDNQRSDKDRPARGRRTSRFLEPGGPKDDRKWMIGVEGVVTQVPPLRVEVVFIDPRFIGRSVAMGGLGLFGRYRPSPFIGFDLSVRSGSVRFEDEDAGDTISHDQGLAELGALVYLGRGEVAQFALSGGLGGMYNRVGYDLGGERGGVHTWGSGVVRLGAEAEFLVKRVAFVLSFRSYGIFTKRDAVAKKGELLAVDRPENDRAPVATLQTQLAVSAGIAYRF